MKTLATISMALVFGTLTLAASTASAKGHPSCNSSHHHNNSGCCDSGCHHHKPCDPCQGNGKCGGGGVVVDPGPVSPPKPRPIYPIYGKLPVTTIFGQPTPTKNPGGLIGRFGGQTISQFGGQKGKPQGGSGGLLNSIGSDLGAAGKGIEGEAGTIAGDVGQGISAAGSALGSAASSVAGLFGL